jgi:hypothetical protein
MACAAAITVPLALVLDGGKPENNYSFAICRF